MTTYIITITLDVPPEADEHLQTRQGVEDEVRSWLAGLGADVRADVQLARTQAATPKEERS